MLVVGAGVIGLELGSVWRRLGSEVLVVEFLDRILPGTDAEIARTLQRILAKQGMSFKLSSKVTGIAKTAAGHKIAIEPAAGGRPRRHGGGGRRGAGRHRPRALHGGPRASRLPASQLDDRKRIAVDPHFQTSVPGIYAIGDVIAGPMLAHKAEDEGVAVAEILAGQAGHVNYDVDPQRHLHLPGGRHRRQVRGGAEGRGRRLQGRQVPFHRQRPRQGQQDHGRASSRSWPTPRPTASWACTSSPRRRAR